MFKKIFFSLLLIINNNICYAKQLACFPAVDSSQSQYIVGYGSLMNDQSRTSTANDIGEAFPVWVKGFLRGWFARGDLPGPNTTFLGVVEDAHSVMNAAIYSLNAASIKQYDKRELFYCRKLVKPAQMRFLTKTSLPSGQVWIYVSAKNEVKLATARYPLISSYVDIFLSGCLHIEKKYKIKGFAEQCIDTTHNWSSYWVNDRIYPRRPWQYQPDALAIDHLLKEKLPQIFSKIKISG